MLLVVVAVGDGDWIADWTATRAYCCESGVEWVS